MIFRVLRLIPAVITASVLGSLLANADLSLTLDSSTTINGTHTLPANTLVAKIQDISTNVVQIPLSSNLQSGSGQFISAWGFNLASTFTDYAHLAFSQVSKTNASFADTTSATSAGTNLTGNSVGSFKVFLDWTGSNHGFGPGGVVTYKLTYTGSSTFGTSLFNTVNSKGFYDGVKVQGFSSGAGSTDFGNTTGPSVLSTPEPGAIALGLSGLTSVGLVRLISRRQSRSA